jgi:hypothetical protein
VKTIFEEHYYQPEEGGLLAACGKLFASDTKLYVYPNLLRDGTLQALQDIPVAANLKHLFQHLLDNNKMMAFEEYADDIKTIHSHEVMTKISLGDTSWFHDVPESVKQAIIEKNMFGYKDIVTPL